MPGLINAHCHLVLNATATAMDDITKISEEESMSVCIKSARKMLQSGFTTIRDCGSLGIKILELRNILNENIKNGPRIISCGRALKTVNGHSFGKEIYGIQEMNETCSEYIHKGVDFIKLMASGGLIDDPHNIGFDEEKMSLAVNIAKKMG